MKDKNKVKYGDLTTGLKVGIIAGCAYVIISILSFTAGFIIASYYLGTVIGALLMLLAIYMGRMIKEDLNGR
jgi:hypothetical protein